VFNGATPLIAARAAVQLAAVATRVVGSVAEDAAAGTAKSFSQIFAGTGDAARPVVDPTLVDSAVVDPASDGGAGPETTPRGRLERAIRDLLSSAGIEISRPIHIDVTATGEIAVTDANRQASAIETTIRGSDAWGGLVADFFEADATADYPGGRISLVVGGSK